VHALTRTYATMSYVIITPYRTRVTLMRRYFYAVYKQHAETHAAIDMKAAACSMF